MTPPKTPIVLVAPDKFRGSLSASQAADAIAKGILRALPDAEVVVRPVADGGDGMIDALARRGARLIPVACHDAFGAEVAAQIAVIGDVAYIESAQMCGLGGREPSDATAMGANSLGLGDAILAAVNTGARKIVVGLGGSATTDGGSGAVSRLGFDLLDAYGLLLVSSELDRVWEVRPPRIGPLPHGVELIVAADVDNPLVGTDGAARMYSPQKGAGPQSVELLEQRMLAWSDALERSFGMPVAAIPGGGAAGGIAIGLHAALAASIVSGASLVLELLDIGREVDRADLVITGEGALDHQSLRGKLPVRIAEMARRADKPVWAIVGRADEGIVEPFDRIGQAVLEAAATQDPFRDAAAIVSKIAYRFARDWRPATEVQ